MDLRVFGIGPRTWLVQLVYQNRDRVLIALGVAILFVSVVLAFSGLGGFWVPPQLIEMAG